LILLIAAMIAADVSPPGGPGSFKAAKVDPIIP
jgi:hypothetical protein